MRGPPILITAVLITLLAILLVGALDFSAGPTISPSDAASNDSLTCRWTPSGTGTLTANVTWYRNGALNRSENSISCSAGVLCQTPIGIPASAVRRPDVWNCSVTISNGTSTTTAHTSVTIANADPTIHTVTSPQSLTEDVAYTYDFNASDPDDGPSQFFWTSREINASDNSTISPPLFRFSDAGSDEITGEINFTPTQSDVGNHTMEITVTDGQEGSDSKIIIYEVIEVNDAPTFSPALADQSATEGVAFRYAIAAIDEENHTPINVSISSDLGSRLIVIQTGPATANITFNTTGNAPEYQDTGPHTVTVTINDSHNATNTGQFTLTVTAVNRPPELDAIANQSGVQGGTLTFSLAAFDNDTTDTLTFAVNDTDYTANTINNSNNATGNITATLGNDDVGIYYLNVSVSDNKGAIDWQRVKMNISNINDAPIINEISNDSSNTEGQTNLSDLIAYVGGPFVYYVNATDIDANTPDGETLTYSINDTGTFSINATTGRLYGTPEEDDVGNITLLLNVSDDGGLWANDTLHIEIRNNSIPDFEPIDNITCTEDIRCTVLLNVTNADRDNITYSSNRSILFPIGYYNKTRALINKTYTQSEVGNYSIGLTVTDEKGASGTESFTLIVEERNDNPILESISFPTIVEEHYIHIVIDASDQDYQLGIENVTFNVSFITGSEIFTMRTRYNTSSSQTYGLINFTPSTDDDGEYSVNITANDLRNGTDWQVVNFTIYNDTLPPNITHIRPYAHPSNESPVDEWRARSFYPNNITFINITENTTITFNHTTTDDTTARENLTYRWRYEGVTNGTGHEHEMTFGFFTSGKRSLELIVYDDRLENTSFTWNLTIADLNREPQLINDLDDIVVNGSTTYLDYFNYYNSEQKFYDPDDDRNGDGIIMNNETPTLTYSDTGCSVATITYNGSILQLTPTEMGNCTVIFFGVDTDNISITSNTVTITVVSPVEQETVENTIDTPGGGSGGGSSTSTSNVPLPIPTENPVPLAMIVPDNVRVGRNRTATIPVTLQNAWDADLEEISVWAETNDSDVKLSFTQTYFKSIPLNGSVRFNISATGYRLGENYDIVVHANVTQPSYHDSATVFLSSIEASEEDITQQQRVTFARDLLNENPECQELNELLDEAIDAIHQGQYERADQLIDGTINGCRYLVSQARKAEETPGRIQRYLRYATPFRAGLVGIGAVLLCAIVLSAYLTHRSKKKG